MLTFDSIVSAGIKRIYEEDYESQKHYLTTLIEDVRFSRVDPILKAQGFFVPNAEYMINYFGPEARSPRLDMYSYGECIWDNYVVFPIRNITNTIVGLTGFDPIQKFRKNEGERSLQGHYKYSNKDVFNRGKYIFTNAGIFDKAIEDEYVCLVDGVFDMLYMNDAGFNTFSLLGSDLSDEILMQLNFIKYMFVVEDNDAAGRKLYNKLSAAFPRRVFYLRQNEFKDIDDMLKSKYRDTAIAKIRAAINGKYSYSLRLKPLVKS